MVANLVTWSELLRTDCELSSKHANAQQHTTSDRCSQLFFRNFCFHRDRIRGCNWRRDFVCDVPLVNTSIHGSEGRKSRFFPLAVSTVSQVSRKSLKSLRLLCSSPTPAVQGGLDESYLRLIRSIACLKLSRIWSRCSARSPISSPSITEFDGVTSCPNNVSALMRARASA